MPSGHQSPIPHTDSPKCWQTTLRRHLRTRPERTIASPRGDRRRLHTTSGTVLSVSQRARINCAQDGLLSPPTAHTTARTRSHHSAHASATARASGDLCDTLHAAPGALSSCQPVDTPPHAHSKWPAHRRLSARATGLRRDPLRCLTDGAISIGAAAGARAARVLAARGLGGT